MILGAVAADDFFLVDLGAIYLNSSEQVAFGCWTIVKEYTMDT